MFSFSFVQAQTEIPLYAGEIPNSRPNTNHETAEYIPSDQEKILIISKVSRPTLTIFQAPKEKATGAAVIVCPGGGYTNLAFGYEGTEVAQKFNEFGITAFVLKYRIPNDSTMIHREIGPLQDAQQAILMVRSRASEWGVDPKKIGIMGFSAGGHLASTAGTHFEKNYVPNPDHVSLRPDFMILIYPVISFKKPNVHSGSANNLIGSGASPETVNYFSNETQVTDQTPPAFLVHAKDDDAVVYANSTEFAKALEKHHIPVEVYLYEQGGHGFGMNNKTSSEHWMDLCIKWLRKEQISY